jgi:uncharacterized membrane protein
VAGVVVSVTMVALVLASQQYGPRLLRSFRRDAPIKVVLGSFVATFAYCLLVLHAVGGGDGGFVPRLSVAASVALALASMGVLIYFIHHLARSIQAESIVAAVAGDLDEVVDQLYPEAEGLEVPAGRGGPRPPPGAEPALAAAPASVRLVASRRDGYVQVVDDDTLMALARAHDLTVLLERRPGHFVTAGQPLAALWPRERALACPAGEVEAAFVLGHGRTPPQDVEFGVMQLVEVAVRALSAAINDPFTAVACVDRLGQSLARLARRPTPSPYRYDPEGRLRVVARPQTFAEIAAVTFDPLRHHGRGHPMVVARLFDAIATVGACAADEDRREVLRAHAQALLEDAERSLGHERDLAAVRAHHGAAVAALGRPPEAGAGQARTAAE